MADLQELEKKYSNKKTTSALTESLSRRAGFTEIGKSLKKMFGGSKRDQGILAKFQISLKGEELELRLIETRNN